jgi:hypothetical protein
MEELGQIGGMPGEFAPHGKGLICSQGGSDSSEEVS